MGVTLVILAYFLLNHPRGAAHNLQTAFDTHWPFMPVLAIPYLLTLPVFWLTLLYGAWQNKKFEALTATVIITYSLSYLIFFVFQTHVVRPADTAPGFLDGLVRAIYSHDPPYNAFPSLHVAMAVILGFYFYQIKSRWLWLVAVFSVLVILSTLFIRQHYILDVIGGLMLSATVSYVCFRKIGIINSTIKN